MSKSIKIHQGNRKFVGLKNSYITINGHKISLWSFGDIDIKKKTIFCISGWPFSGYTYWPLMSELETEYQFIGIDIPGFLGYSEAKDFVPTGSHISSLLYDVIISLGVMEYGLLGISAGGAYIVDLYNLFYERLKKKSILSRLLTSIHKPRFMILIAPALVGNRIAYFNNPTTTEVVFNQLKKSGDLGNLLQRMILSAVGIKAIKEVIYRTNKQLHKQKEIITIMQEELVSQKKGITFQSLLASGDDLLHNNRTSLLSNIRCPVLFITGTKDTTIDPETTEENSKLCRDSRFVKIPDAPHFLIVTHQKELAREIEEFLKYL